MQPGAVVSPTGTAVSAADLTGHVRKQFFSGLLFALGGLEDEGLYTIERRK